MRFGRFVSCLAMAEKIIVMKLKNGFYPQISMIFVVRMTGFIFGAEN
jgi:hypothetical protein